MNRTMLIGVVAGVGIAVAGGVAGFSLLGNSSVEDEQGTAQLDESTADAAPAVASTEAAPQASPAPVAARTSQAPAPQPAPAQRTASAPQPAPEPEIECWDEEVTVQADPRDEKKVAGTAAGALIGGALADKLGDDNKVVTAAGAAAGALLGRKAQEKYQDNKTTTTTERRCGPVGSH